MWWKNNLTTKKLWHINKCFIIWPIVTYKTCFMSFNINYKVAKASFHKLKGIKKSIFRELTTKCLSKHWLLIIIDGKSPLPIYINRLIKRYHLDLVSLCCQTKKTFWMLGMYVGSNVPDYLLYGKEAHKLVCTSSDE